MWWTMTVLRTELKKQSGTGALVLDDVTVRGEEDGFRVRKNLTWRSCKLDDMVNRLTGC